jgi:hypothetical protein
VKNITITLDERTAAWARNAAAQQGMSLSRYVGELLERSMRQSGEYERAMRRYLQKKPQKLKDRSIRYPSREELHERWSIR